MGNNMTFEQFAEYLDLTLEHHKIDRRTDGLGGQFDRRASHYSIRLLRGTNLVCAVEYSMGSGHKSPPEIEDVLLSLFHDTCDLHGTEVDSLSDFAEWVDHVGHDNLPEAVKMFQACHSTFDQLKDTLTHEEREAFYDCTEDEQEPNQEEISQRFDNEIMPSVIQQYGENDKPAINEAFNNWTDGLCKDGQISSLLYSRIEYVGQYES